MKNPGLELGKLRKRGTYRCAVCGEPFEGMKTRSVPKFCSNRCKQRDKYQRSKQA